MMTTRTHEQTIRDWVGAAWNCGDFSSADTLYTPDYQMNDSSQPEPVVGAHGLVAFVTAYRTAFPDLRLDVDEIVCEGDRSAWRFTVRGTHLGELMGIPASGRPMVCRGMVFTRFASDGRWAEDHVVYDAFSMLRQVGAIPS